jgi:hypothetical protein
MAVNGRDLVKVTSAVLCIKPGDLVSYLASYARVRRTNSHIYIQNSKFFQQGSVLGPILIILYTSDFPITNNTTTDTLADSTVILATHADPRTASHLQLYLNLTQEWLKKWRIKINETKSVHITSTLREGRCPPVTIKNAEIPIVAMTKYLGMHLDHKLSWRDHNVMKRKQIELKVKELYWLLGRKSQLSIENKLLIYKTIIRPIWTYGIEIWGCASKSSQAVLQKAQ